MYISHNQMQDTTITQKRAYVHRTEFTKTTKNRRRQWEKWSTSHSVPTGLS